MDWADGLCPTGRALVHRRRRHARDNGEGRVLAVGTNHKDATIAADTLNPPKAAVPLAPAMTQTPNRAA